MNPTTNTEAGAVADVAAIARGLSERQQLAVKLCFQDEARHAPYHVFANTPANRAAWRDMIPMGFVTREDEGFDLVITRGNPIAMVGLTPLCLAVRQHLEQGATAS